MGGGRPLLSVEEGKYVFKKLLDVESFKTALMQVNETLLRSIVTQPWRDNYVYAWNFSSLALVKNVVLSKTCRVVVTPAPTTAPTVIPPTGTPSGNGK